VRASEPEPGSVIANEAEWRSSIDGQAQQVRAGSAVVLIVVGVEQDVAAAPPRTERHGTTRPSYDLQSAVIRREGPRPHCRLTSAGRMHAPGSRPSRGCGLSCAPVSVGVDGLPTRRRSHVRLPEGGGVSRAGRTCAPRFTPFLILVLSVKSMRWPLTPNPEQC